MMGVFWRIIKDKKIALVAYILGAMATVEMYIALFPAIRDQADELNKLLEAYPKGFLEAFGFESGSAAFFSKLEAYMSTEYFSFFWPIMVITMMIAFANAMIAAEVEKGTVELVLAQPISRIKLFFTRYFAGIFYFLIFCFFSIFVMIPFAELHSISYQFENYVTTFGMSLLFGVTIFSMAVFFSAIFSEKGKATALSAAVLLIMYVLNIVSSLKDNLKDLEYASFFHYFDPSKVLGKNEIVEWSVPVFLGVIIVFTVGAALWFNRRDIAT